MGGLLKPNGPWKPVRLVLDRLRRLSRSERPKLLYDGRHPPGSGDQWPAVAQGLVGREELAGGKWEGQLGLGVSSCQGYRMYLQGFHSQFFSFYPELHSYTALKLGCQRRGTFIVASVIWYQIFCSNPPVFVVAISFQFSCLWEQNT